MPATSTEFGVGAVSLSEGELSRALSQATAEGSVLSGNALKAVVEWAACRGLNRCAEIVYAQSQVEVPEAEVHDYTRAPQALWQTGQYPGNNAECRATPAKPYAEVGYDAAYAWAQHEAFMVYERDGTPVSWEVQNYTKEGSKAQYLADPFKAVLPEVELIVGEEVAKAVAEFSL